MGGTSFKCPKCGKWFLHGGSLHSHLVDKHGEPRGFTLRGTGPQIEIVRDRPLDFTIEGLEPVGLYAQLTPEQKQQALSCRDDTGLTDPDSP